MVLFCGSGRFDYHVVGVGFFFLGVLYGLLLIVWVIVETSIGGAKECIIDRDV